jgi:hypothetical protein
MIRLDKSGISFLILSLGVSLGACDDAATEPSASIGEDVLVLNSTGQTLASFSVAEGVARAGDPIDLGAGFDGDAFDLSPGFAVTTVSSFGGSRILFVDLGAGAVLTTSFPEPESDLANPSAPTFDSRGTAWVGGRGSDAVYKATPGEPSAERVAGDVGTFVERVVPVADKLYVVDANIDDDGGTYEPLGPGRIVVLSLTGAVEAVIDLPAGTFNPTEALVSGGDLLVLAAGTFDPVTFLPANDGALVPIDLSTGAVGTPVELEANGVSLESGGDGLVYLTTTSDYQTLDLLQFDPGIRAFTRGPADPIRVSGGDGGRVDCWSALGLRDGRILCSTFSFAEAGRLVLADADGRFIDEVQSGFGSTDLALW